MAVELNEGDVLEMRLNYEDGVGTKAFNVLHYRLSSVSVAGGGLFPGEDFAAIASEIAEALYEKVAGVWADGAVNDCRILGTTIANVYPLPRSASFTYSAELPQAGSIAGEAMPLQDSPTIVKRTAFGARWGIGRVYFVGLAESQQEGGLLNALGIASVQAFANILASNLVYVNGVYTYTFGPVLFGAPPPGSAVPRTTQLVSMDLSDSIIKTQRRRRPGKGI